MSLRPDLDTIWKAVCSDSGREFLRAPQGVVPYGQLDRTIRGFCSAFDGPGMVPGSRVLIVTANEAVAGAAFLAALLDGLVPVMLSPDSRPDRIQAIRASVAPGMIVADETLAGHLASSGVPVGHVLGVPSSASLGTQQPVANATWRRVRRLFGGGGRADELNLPEPGRAPRLPAADDTTGYILFTSGTTSSPSGVLISRRSLVAQLETQNRLFGYSRDSRIFNATPLAHTDGLVQGLLLAATNGATLLRPGPFTLPGLEAWLDRLSAWRATHFITNPTMLGLIERFAGHDDYFDDEGFAGVLSSASTLRPELWESFEARFACPVFNIYGMTETVANATYAGRHPEMGPVGSIGIPVDCEVRLVAVGADGVSGETALQGELQVRGENVFQGYWKDPERTGRTLVAGGWMRTGDLARWREDGGLDIVGRIKTMINMGGHSIMPEEIDEVLAKHPAVLDVATVGLSDPEFEEVAIAAVVLGRPVPESELTEHCRQRLEPLKVPKRILAVDRIPRGDAGKPRTGELRELLERRLASGAGAPAQSAGKQVGAETVFAMAAEVFQVPVEALSVDSSPATVDGWDSFNQLNLMIEAEHRFEVSIPASRVASIRTLGDLLRAINAGR